MADKTYGSGILSDRALEMIMRDVLSGMLESALLSDSQAAAVISLKNQIEVEIIHPEPFRRIIS